MRFTFLAAAAILIPAHVFAQAPRVSLVVSAVDSKPIITITNNYNLAITAYSYTVDHSRQKGPLFNRYFDIYIDNFDHRDDHPIQTGSSRQEPLPYNEGSSPSDWYPVVFRAAVFADGTTWGDADYTSKLLQRRNTILACLEEVTGILQGIVKQNLSPSDAITVLEQARDGQRAANPGEPFEDRVATEGRIFFVALAGMKGTRTSSGGLVVSTSEKAKEGISYLEKWKRYLQSAIPSPVMQQSAVSSQIEGNKAKEIHISGSGI